MGWVLGASALVAGSSALAASSAVDLYYERTVMSAADARCGLFEPTVGAALNSARAQARGAALRGGAAPDSLTAVDRRARAKAAAASCNSADLRVAAGRVRKAFDGYARLIRMSWPGDIAGWNANRTVTRQGALWRLSQTTSFGHDRMVFGLGGEEGGGILLASVSFADGRTPYAARLVMRDPARAALPYLDRGRVGAKGVIPLPSRLPPASATRAFSAETRSVASDRLRPQGTTSGWLYRFPTRAADALADLDPREAVAVEFVFSGARGDEVRRAWIEVGDFAAGRAFLQVTPR